MSARVVVGALILVAVSCGKRGDPLPPLRRYPEGVERLLVAQRGAFIHLEWSTPTRNTDGSTDLHLESAEVLRRVVEIRPEAVASPAQDEETPGEVEPDEARASEEQAPAAPPPFPEGASVVATLESPPEGDIVSYSDPWEPSWEGKRLEYAVRHINRQGRRGGLSFIAQIDPLAPLDPPQQTAAEADAGLVRLQWSFERETSADSRYALGFNVYRRGETELYSPSPLNGVPIEGSVFEDRTVRFGNRWCYIIRTAAVPLKPEEDLSARDPSPTLAPGPRGDRIESLDSEEVCLTPVDKFPPPTPTNLVAVEDPEGILLSWDVVDMADLKGYLVYRGTQADGPFELLTQEPIALASYTDRQVEAEAAYFYAVSSVDGAEPPNESSRSRAVPGRPRRRR